MKTIVRHGMKGRKGRTWASSKTNKSDKKHKQKNIFFFGENTSRKLLGQNDDPLGIYHIWLSNLGLTIYSVFIFFPRPTNKLVTKL